MRKLNLEGKRFGRWLVLSRSNRCSYYNCICDCGKEREVSVSSLNAGTTKSCGCLRVELTKQRERIHGMCGTKEHKIWMSMISRAHAKNSSHSFYYEQLGIGVCDRWVKSFENFFNDMGQCPDGLTLERVDNRLGYSPENCKWDTASRQASNRRKNKLNTSGRIGVHFRKDKCKYRVVIKVDKVRHNIGQFDSYEEACAACTEAELSLLGYSREGY